MRRESRWIGDTHIDEIIAATGTVDHDIRKHEWWNRIMDPNDTAYRGVLENGMTCEALPKDGPVERVVSRVERR